MSFMLVDSHCHLNLQPLREDLNGVIDRASGSNVKVLHTICTELEELQQILDIASIYPQVFCSAGVHPLNIDAKNICKPEILIALSAHKKIISFGETGLDYHYGIETKAIQQQSFINHIKAAQIAELPLVIHTRAADEDTVHILKKEQIQEKKFKAVIHCFTASEWLAEQCLDMGLYLSAAGIITFKNAHIIQQVFKAAPLDRILIETDAPYLAPVPKRGKKNEPSYIIHTAEFLAALRNSSLQEIAEATTKNFFDLFTKAALPS